MANNYFAFKQFTIYQEKAAFKVGTDGVILGACVDVNSVKRILEIGSGTGLIALMLAQRSDAEIVTIEPDDGSFIQTCENVRLCKWSKRIKVLHTDLQNYSEGNDKFDLIVTNPPFFSASLKNSDPRRSLARHNDNLTTEELLEGVKARMADDGRFVLIMPYAEGNIFIAEAGNFGFYCNGILKIRPLPSHDIRRLVMTFSKYRMKATERFLTIEKGQRHEFTEEYINLTKDFYLGFK